MFQDQIENTTPLLSPFKELEKMGIKIFLDNGSFELKKYINSLQYGYREKE